MKIKKNIGNIRGDDPQVIYLSFEGSNNVENQVPKFNEKSGNPIEFLKLSVRYNYPL